MRARPRWRARGPPSTTSSWSEVLKVQLSQLLVVILAATLLTGACQTARNPVPCVDYGDAVLQMIQPPRLEPGDTIMFVSASASAKLPNR